MININYSFCNIFSFKIMLNFSPKLCNRHFTNVHIGKVKVCDKTALDISAL